MSTLKISFLITLVIVISASAQQPATFRLGSVEIQSNGPYSNVVEAFSLNTDTLWVGTHRGVDMTFGNGNTWKHFQESDGIKEFGVSAIASRSGIVWVAQNSTRDDEARTPVGEGFHFSTNGGQSWTFIEQPREPKGATIDTLMYGSNQILALAVPVPEGNITYDIALTSSTIWTANFYGMLRKSTDGGQTWQRVILPPDNFDSISPDDTLDFDLSPSQGELGLRESLNHRVFSLYASGDSVIWVGTAGGINKSTDGGISWRRFSHQNQAEPISGNWARSLRGQIWNGKEIIWSGTANTFDQDEFRGLSFTHDGGESWNTALAGELIHNIAFKDSIIYAATDNGLYRSSDFGETWIRTGTIYDTSNLHRFSSTVIYTVETQGDTVWIGGIDGAAYTLDTPSQPFGNTWKIFRTAEPVGNSSITYSYPSPFSPDDESVRIHYSTQGKTASVTIRVFNYAMQPVRTLLQQAPRSGVQEHDEIWDGRDDYNRRISNGVYFYTVEVGGLEPVWGKIYVIE